MTGTIRTSRRVVADLRAHHLSVSEISKRTGISKRKLYKHWRRSR